MERGSGKTLAIRFDARSEIIRIMAERYLHTLTPGTAAYIELNELIIKAGWASTPHSEDL